MTRIAVSDQLAAMVRAQIASFGSRRKSGGALGAAGKPVADHRPAKARGDMASLAAARIEGIDRDDPDAPARATRIFLECVLLAELGPQLVSDPGFGRMVDHVQQQLQADSELALATAEAAQVLLSAARP
ncbi:MAG: hypothetical protein JWQ33_3064 [Ramlibacter sp.]|nr:hypothetical protein [Ramlibacter sp.]